MSNSVSKNELKNGDGRPQKSIQIPSYCSSITASTKPTVSNFIPTLWKIPLQIPFGGFADKCPLSNKQTCTIILAKRWVIANWFPFRSEQPFASSNHNFRKWSTVFRDLQFLEDIRTSGDSIERCQKCFKLSTWTHVGDRLPKIRRNFARKSEFLDLCF